ncbi:hypothetical protein MAH1_16210 [Sessilibacter sp. MAH1]
MPEWLYLALLLTIPPLLSITLVVIIFKQNEDSLHSEIKKIFQLDEKSLHNQRIFWHSIMLPVLYFLALCSLFWEDYDLCLTVDGINTFWDLGKLQLAVLSTSIPLSILASRAHSTYQTEIQIKTARDKNNFDFYNEQRKDLLDYFDKLPEKNYHDVFTGKFLIDIRLHYELFLKKDHEYLLQIKNSDTENTQSFEDLDKSILAAGNALINLKQKVIFDEFDAESHFEAMELSRSHHEDYRYFSDQIRQLISVLLMSELRDIAREGATIYETVDDDVVTTWKAFGSSTKECVAIFSYVYDYYLYLCLFSGRKPKQKFIHSFTDVEKITSNIDDLYIDKLLKGFNRNGSDIYHALEL